VKSSQTGTQKDTKFLETISSSRIDTNEVFLIQMQQHYYLSGSNNSQSAQPLGSIKK